MHSSLQPSSLPTYRSAWSLFHQFHGLVFPYSTVHCFPISASVLALFIAYLYDKQYASSTVDTYVSALGYSHKLAGVEDSTNVFFIVQILKGYGKKGFQLDSSLSVTLPILERILSIAHRVTSFHYDAYLFGAMCVVAFYVFLRVGEMTVNGRKVSNFPLQFQQVTRLCNRSHIVKEIKIYFRDYKHNYKEHPFSVIIHRQTEGYCHVTSLLEYLNHCSHAHGPLFKLQSGEPVPRSTFSYYLSLAIKECGLDPACYKGHSFRIGAAFHAAALGFTDAQIRMFGRWKLNAFHKYIRVNILSALKH